MVASLETAGGARRGARDGSGRERQGVRATGPKADNHALSLSPPIICVRLRQALAETPRRQPHRPSRRAARLVPSASFLLLVYELCDGDA